MAHTREILTIQLGSYSNYVGSHWWNLQEAGFSYAGKPSDINHDVLFREGINSQNQVTFTPRLLLVDLKGSLHHLRIEGELYDVPVPDVNEAPWPTDKVQVEVAPERKEKNEFLKDVEAGAASSVGGGDGSPQPGKVYNLDKDVKTWSDFLVSRFHPRTVFVTNEYEHNSSEQPFDIYNYGTNLYKNGDFEDEFTDRIRNYLEECENAQGFQVLYDGTDGFGGIASSLSEYLADEYRNKSILALPLISPIGDITPLQECIRTVNFALSLQKVSELASFLVPLGTDSKNWRSVGPPRTFPHLKYDSSSPYHTSAILATAIDTFSLRYRLRNGSDRMSDMIDPMRRHGRSVACCSLGLPFGIKEGDNLLHTLETWEGPLWTSLTPHCNPDIEDLNHRLWMQSVVIRGIPQKRLRGPPNAEEKPNSAMSCDSPSQLLQAYLDFSSNGTYSHVSSSESPCKVKPPFPRIFKPSVALNGDILSHGSRSELLNMNEVPVVSGVHSCDAIGVMLKSLHSETARLNIKRFPAYAKAGLEADDYEESLEKLYTLSENYDEKYEM
ncbi:Protein misato [Frankliniella fusca]|uniref:Protein misato n=1 Tax=Frankliniella fusca TaxID=407009 RepID=A0AAE1H2H1_9NEOP|nr:Protein misato [Frankliniella fusca]